MHCQDHMHGRRTPKNLDYSAAGRIAVRVPHLGGQVQMAFEGNSSQPPDRVGARPVLHLEEPAATLPHAHVINARAFNAWPFRHHAGR